MATIEKFEDLEVWKEARKFSLSIFELTKNEPFSKDFDLIRQIKRSSGSIMDNIAEGFERSGNRELIQFLAIAKGSCGETRSQLYRAFDQKYLPTEIFDLQISSSISISKKLNSLITYLKKSDIKGTKYQTS